MKRSQLQLQLNYSTQNCAINYLQLTHKKHWIAIKKHWNTRWNKKNTRFSGKTLRVVPLLTTLHNNPWNHCWLLAAQENTLLPSQKHSQLPVSETFSVLMSSVLQSSSELVPKSLKAENAAAAKLLMSWGSTAFPVLKMQVASQGI